MRRIVAIGAVAAMVLVALAVMPQSVSANSAWTEPVSYPDQVLTGGSQAGHFAEVWDLTASDLAISFTYDANGLVDDAGAHAWAELGVRQQGKKDFNPQTGSGVWLATDYDWTPGTFDPDPPGAPTLDMDDKLILQRQAGNGEGAYNLPSPPPVPGNNHRVWWDRDGVDPWQGSETANTGGLYQIVLKLHATSATAGTAYMNIRGLYQGFETDGNWNTIELKPAGMTFTGDMRHMQVFFGLYGYGATHSVAFRNIKVVEAMFYPDCPLSGGYEADHFADVWDLTTRDMTIGFTYDANGLVDEYGGEAHAWAELGVRATGYGDFNPTWETGGAGVWLATDYEWSVGTFDPDPPGAPTLDLDDKLILQRGGNMDEAAYDLPSTPPAPGDNHRVWWDRDGVDPYQNPETANTKGLYRIVITLHATSATTGTAYMRIRGLDQGFETDGHWDTIELTPAGMTFTGDMRHMQVFFGLYGYGPDGVTHSVTFRDILVTGRFWRIDATVDVHPDDFNADSNLRTVTVYIELPAGYLVGDIVVNSVRINTVPPQGSGIPPLPKWTKIGDYDGDLVPDLMLKFDITPWAESWHASGKVGDVTLVVSGFLTSGERFEGSDTVHVFCKGAI